MPTAIPQAFLNGYRSAAGLGMQDARSHDMRSADQWLGVSGNPNLVYNQPRQVPQAIGMPAQASRLPVFQAQPNPMPQGGPVAMPVWNVPQRTNLPMDVQRQAVARQLPPLRGMAQPMPKPANQPQRIPFVEDQLVDPQRQRYAQLMLR